RFKRPRRIELTMLAGPALARDRPVYARAERAAPIRARSRHPRSSVLQACRPWLRRENARSRRRNDWETDSTDTNGHKRTVVPARRRTAPESRALGSRG